MTTRIATGECERIAKALLRGAELPAAAEVAMLGIARYADELARRIDHLEDCTPHVQPPVPLQMTERYDERERLGDVFAPYRELR